MCLATIPVKILRCSFSHYPSSQFLEVTLSYHPQSVYTFPPGLQSSYSYISPLTSLLFQKQPSGGVLKKRGSENIQQNYGRTPMPKRHFNKVALQLYWNRTSAGMFSCRFTAYFQEHFFIRTLLEGCFYYFM